MINWHHIRIRNVYLIPCAVAFLAIGAGILLSTRKDPAPTHSKLQPVATLPDGTRFPLASFGLQIYDDDKAAYDLTRMALSVGYRNFVVDTGHRRTFSQACVDSGIPREELFVTAALPLHAKDEDDLSFRRIVRRDNNISGDVYEWTLRQCYEIMAEFFAINYLDQILLDSYPGTECADIRGQWRALEEMVRAKNVRTLGVTNFSPAKLDCLLHDPNLKTMPVVNQLPYNIAYHPAYTIRDNRARGILVQAWSPLGGSLGNKFNDGMRSDCADVGKRYYKSFAQVALRWVVQKGAAFTTQSTVRGHFEEDINIFDFELSDEDIAILDALASAA